MNQFLAVDFKSEPYWWRTAPPRHLAPSSIAARYDVAIIGSGFTGLHAALVLARAGADVLVIEAEGVGYGASRRNAGYLGRSLKKSYPALVDARGEAFARRIYGELDEAYQSTFAFIEREGLDCYAVRCGRLIAGTSAAHLTKLIADCERTRQDMGFEYRVLSFDEMHEEIGSSAYCGGVVIPDQGSIHPGMYHEGLLTRVQQAGASILTDAPVTRMERTSGGFRLHTDHKLIDADRLVVATNGYTPKHLKRLARRVIPFTGYMAATEELPEEVLNNLIPHRRTVLDTNLNIDFFRPAPDSLRLLFGGSTGSAFSSTGAMHARLHGLMVNIFPQLSATKLSAVWTGKCAATFDMMPHIGEEDGLWYGLGYNFAGVPLGSHFGQKIGLQILGQPEGQSVFSENRLTTVPFYGGTPWFVPMTMRFFDWQDRRLAVRSV